MHIRSKFDGGKQINRSQSGSWEARCAGAALRVNEGPEWGPKCWEKITKLKNNQTYKTVSAKRTKQLARDNKRKASETVKLQRKKGKEQVTPYRAAWIIPAMTVKDQMPVKSHQICLLPTCVML